MDTVCIYVNAHRFPPTWLAEHHAPWPAQGKWRAEVTGCDSYDSFDFPGLKLWVLVSGEMTPDAMRELATGYADGSLPRVKVDLSQCDLSRKDAREWKAANRAQAKEARKDERRQRFVYEGQRALGDEHE